MILSILPDTTSIRFKIIDIMATMIVNIHAQPLPVRRPQATTNPAIPITTSIPPIIPKNPPNKKSALRGIVTSVPLMFRENEEFDVLLLLWMLT